MGGKKQKDSNKNWSHKNDFQIDEVWNTYHTIAKLIVPRLQTFKALDKHGYKKSTLERMWKDWEHKGMYAFNKAHAVCYSWLAYQMAYLKANYPEEFHLVIKDSQCCIIKTGIHDKKYEHYS